MRYKLNMFARWLIKHYSTSTDENHSFCYRNPMGEIVEIPDVVNHYMENQYEQAEEITPQTVYSKEDVIKAGEMGEINHHDTKHIVSYLDEAKTANLKKLKK